jgi:hypothetical protein
MTDLTPPDKRSTLFLLTHAIADDESTMCVGLEISYVHAKYLVEQFELYHELYSADGRTSGLICTSTGFLSALQLYANSAWRPKTLEEETTMYPFKHEGTVAVTEHAYIEHKVYATRQPEYNVEIMYAGLLVEYMNLYPMKRFRSAIIPIDFLRNHFWGDAHA